MSPPTDHLVVRTIGDDEVEQFAAFFPRQFGSVTLEGEHERIRSLLPLERMHVAVDRDEFVGTAAAYDMRLSIPGGEVAAAGLTRVSVSPTHRRQGLLGRLIDAHFDASAAAEDPVSILWASEAAIYGRFGYGPATENCRITFRAPEAGIVGPEDPDIVRFADDGTARAHLPDVHERVRSTTPGMFHRSPQWWEQHRFVDHDWMQDEGGPRRTVIAFRPPADRADRSRDGGTDVGRAVGFATYRQKAGWSDDDLPQGSVLVAEVIAVDHRAERTLWTFLANLDLFPRVVADLNRPDLPVPWWATNSRAVSRSINDGLWLRVLDVAAALQARRYVTAGELVFDLIDDRRPDQAGTWLLSVTHGSDGLGTARCSRTDRPPEVRLTAAALGSVYLGGQDPAGPAASGAIEADEAGVAVVRELFRWPGPTWCDVIF